MSFLLLFLKDLLYLPLKIKLKGYLTSYIERYLTKLTFLVHTLAFHFQNIKIKLPIVLPTEIHTFALQLNLVTFPFDYSMRQRVAPCHLAAVIYHFLVFFTD